MDGSALPLDFVEKNGSGAGHVQRRYLPGHGDGDDLVTVLAAALAQAAGFVADDEQRWCGERGVGEGSRSPGTGADYLEGGDLAADLVQPSRELGLGRDMCCRQGKERAGRRANGTGVVEVGGVAGDDESVDAEGFAGANQGA